MGKIKSFLLVVVGSCLLSSCSSFTPGSGPSGRTITNIDETTQENTAIFEIDNQLVAHLSQVQRKKIFSELPQGRSAYNTVGVGDILEITIWEAPPAVLFSGPIDQTGSGMANVTVLPNQTVDQYGKIIVPFLGALKVVDKTPNQVSNMITNQLKVIANQPQVLARIVKNNSKLVTIIKDGNSIQLPLTPKQERILDAVAAIQGSSQSVNKISVQLTRADRLVSLPLMHIINNPKENILLQSGDVVSLLYEPLHFTVLGATGVNKELGFEAEGITLAQALGRIGGLDDNRANAQGVFIFRFENNEHLKGLKGYQENLDGVQKIPTVYKANLKDPNSFFYAQNFVIQDKDVLYVSNATGTELNKFLRIIFSWTSPTVSTVNTFK